MKANKYQLQALRHAPDAVAFDWDNTLFDHDKHLAYLSENLIKAIGHEPYPTNDEMNALWHVSEEECCKTYFPGYTPDQVLAKWKTFQNEIQLDTTEMLPGAMETLDSLRSMGIPMLIISNKPEDLLRKELAHFGLTDYFEAVVGGHENKKLRKPHFHPLEKALLEVNEKREKTGEPKLGLGNLWLVGDESADAGIARSSGIQRFIVGTTHRDHIASFHENNDPAGSMIFLDTIAEFGDIVRQIKPKAAAMTV